MSEKVVGQETSSDNAAVQASTVAQVLIGGVWREANYASVSIPTSPLPQNDPAADLSETSFPVSQWEDCNEALEVASEAFKELRNLPPEKIATFLETYADRLEANAKEICEMAHRETALPYAPRLFELEMPRTIHQIRLSAVAARSASWALPTIDTANNIRSCLGPLGPVAVLGPNNFPLAYGSVSGGDFASAIAAGNPVIAISHHSHPNTIYLMAKELHQAAESCQMPSGTVQLIHRVDRKDGLRLISDKRLAAAGFTGGKKAGLALKKAADEAGNLIYLEMSSLNPVLILPGALTERPDEILDELQTSCLMAAGQFCTSPNLIFLLKSQESKTFIENYTQKVQEAPNGILVGPEVASGLAEGITQLRQAGADLLVGDKPTENPACRENTLLQVRGDQFLKNSEALQVEAFGNSAMFVVADDLAQLGKIIESLEGNLTGTIYSAANGSDDKAYDAVVSEMRQKVGRLLNDKMPTGVAVSAAMNHGGPYPATGHAGFTAVGVPGALRRFGMLHCYDNVREHRLPTVLRNKNELGTWRLVDGESTKEDLSL